MIRGSLSKLRTLRFLFVLVLAFASIALTSIGALAQSNSQAKAERGLPGAFSPAAERQERVLGGSAAPKTLFGSVRNNGNHDVFSMELDGSNQTRLTTDPAYDDQPKWSPDSSKIAFMSDRDGNFEIYTMNADGTGQTRITNSPFADGFPAWSHDGTKIAFVRGDLRNPFTFEIFVMNADGSNQTQLTNDPFIDGVPSWSPDNTKIVFMSGGNSVLDVNSFEIFVMNADGSGRTRLTNNAIVDGQPSYSPDGTRILFASGDGFNPNGIEIFVMNADGSNRVQLTSNDVTDGFPAWSFDGSNIVFASGSIADETTVELFMMNANGTNPAKITTNSNLDWFPDWEPISTPPSQLQFSQSTFNRGESSGSADITITRTGNITGTASVRYTTSDTAGASNCNVIDNKASSRCDYLTMLGTLNFAPGESSKTISVFLVDDSYVESPESFTISLSNAAGSGVGLGSPATATVIIASDDLAPGGPNPIDNASFFVRQHYIDFLNREPDVTGLAFWTDQITSCGSDVQCTEIRRINVSAAFFLSIEFQETGYLVERLYKAAYGIAQGTSTLGGPHQLSVPIVRLNEFLPDTQQIGKGVIIGQPGADQLLENNKQALIAEFVLRSRFTTAFPPSMTVLQFVNTLNGNAGGPLSTGERDQLVTDLTSGAKTRAQVLRAVAEDPDLFAAERNGAFVLVQYFGYLRRNQNDTPDSDYTGYDFWLNKLNEFNGNFVNAEMVKAFLVSAEYRHRFGP